MNAFCFFRLSATSHRLERDRGVEEAEEDDQRDVDHGRSASRRAARIWCSQSMPGTLRLASVAGNISSDDAKIGGITPAVFTLQRQVRGLAAVHLPADHALGVVDRDAALRALEEHDHRDDRDARCRSRAAGRSAGSGRS